MSNGKRKFRPIALVIFCFSFLVCADSMASDVKIIEAAKKEGGEIEAYATHRHVADRVAEEVQVNYKKHLDEFRNYFGK